MLRGDEHLQCDEIAILIMSWKAAKKGPRGFYTWKNIHVKCHKYISKHATSAVVTEDSLCIRNS